MLAVSETIQYWEKKTADLEQQLRELDAAQRQGQDISRPAAVHPEVRLDEGERGRNVGLVVAKYRHMCARPERTAAEVQRSSTATHTPFSPAAAFHTLFALVTSTRRRHMSYIVHRHALVTSTRRPHTSCVVHRHRRYVPPGYLPGRPQIAQKSSGDASLTFFGFVGLGRKGT